MEILKHMFFDYNNIGLEINSKKITGKSPNTWELNNTFLYNPWIKEEGSKEIKK